MQTIDRVIRSDTNIASGGNPYHLGVVRPNHQRLVVGGPQKVRCRIGSSVARQRPTAGGQGSTRDQRNPLRTIPVLKLLGGSVENQQPQRRGVDCISLRLRQSRNENPRRS